MPVTNQSYLQPYDFRGWRDRMGYTKAQAAVTLGLSESTYWRMEKNGIGGRLHGWAAFGVETYVRQQRETMVAPAVQPK